MNKLTALAALALTLAVPATAAASNGYTPPTYPPHDPAPCTEHRLEKATATWSSTTGWSAFTDWPGAGPLEWNVTPNPRTGPHGGTEGKNGYRVFAYVAVDKRAITTGDCTPATTVPPTTVPATTVPPSSTVPETTTPATTPATTTPPTTVPATVITTPHPTTTTTTPAPTLPATGPSSTTWLIAAAAALTGLGLIARRTAAELTDRKDNS